MTAHRFRLVVGQLVLFSAVSWAAIWPDSADADTLYRWVDERGRVTYSQHPPPAATGRNVQQRRFADSPSVDTSLPYAARIAAEQFPVTLFTAPDCGASCAAARDSLSSRGIPFKEVSVRDTATLETLKTLSGTGNVPVLQVGREVLTTFEQSSWQRALDIAGYPASIPRRAGPQPSTGKTGERPPVKLYTAKDCGEYCSAARKLLEERGVAFQEVTVADAETEAEMKKLFPDAALPALAVGSARASGFDSQRYIDMLDAAGFPLRAAGPDR